MFKEFKEFAIKGNAFDLAVGVIIGAAFGKIVSSLVSDVIMPAVGLLLGKVNFSTLAFTVGSSTIKYGSFIQAIVDFVIIAFVIFLMVKQINKFKKEPAIVAPTTKECGYCKMVIAKGATKCPHCTSQLN
jgi:large conductance mechanosensitive channel